MSMPVYGQRSNANAAPECPRHPGVRSVDYCKRCNRPMCVECVVPTEVRSICVDCSGRARRPISRRGPVVTYAIIAACLLAFLVGFGSNSAYSAMLFTPGLGLAEPWRFLTTAFLHSGIFHIVFNMVALYSVGTVLEPVLGHWRYAFLYALSAVGGSAAVLAWGIVEPATLMGGTVGASGAVFGLFGAVFVLQKASGADTRAIIGLLVVNLLYGFIGANISWQAHLGGLITGVLVSWAFLRQGRPRPGVTAKSQQRREVLVTAAMGAAMLALIALIYRVIFEVVG
ncbi:rhomboid family intramembrane serine protease [Actinomyces sp. B33]|uniref:rhomboid family intramembrane serine protease n=1 Tax=Actinomyces sp. B33 TaxID=2942131 RepID=UPI0023414D63|nr:rhomboid family intramembrane serine protease [Actinomyces sp. B33]MDC4233963.1 rhomboid family intramembrane serine protease [Actinomyces sp. B33]